MSKNCPIYILASAISATDRGDNLGVECDEGTCGFYSESEDACGLSLGHPILFNRRDTSLDDIEERTVDEVDIIARDDAELAQLRQDCCDAEGWDADEIEFTCDGCSEAPVCEFAFDPYNADGDCLAEDGGKE